MGIASPHYFLRAGRPRRQDGPAPSGGNRLERAASPPVSLPPSFLPFACACLGLHLSCCISVIFFTRGPLATLGLALGKGCSNASRPICVFLLLPLPFRLLCVVGRYCSRGLPCASRPPMPVYAHARFWIASEFALLFLPLFLVFLVFLLPPPPPPSPFLAILRPVFRPRSQDNPAVRAGAPRSLPEPGAIASFCLCAVRSSSLGCGARIAPLRGSGLCDTKKKDGDESAYVG